MKKEEKIKIIKQIISDYYDVDEQLINSKTRKSEVIKVRHLILYMIRYEMGITFREISDILSKEVSTVVRNFQSISSQVNHDKVIQKEIADLKKSIREKLEVIV